MAKATDKQVIQPRFFQQTEEIHCDTYRLEVAKMIKNMAFNKGAYDLEKIEHVHHFHTYNSDGKKEVYCQNVGGHTHKINYKEVEGGVPEIISVGPPIQIIKKTVRGKKQLVEVQLDPNLEDNHTHEINYRSSSKVLKRQLDPRAAQMQGDEAQKVKPVAGVIG